MSYRLEYTAWLTGDGKRLLGEREAELFRLIAERGTVAEAAAAGGYDVQAALRVVGEVEGSLGRKVLADGSGLNGEGEMLLREYECRAERMAEQLRQLYRNPAFAADGIVIVDRKVLLVKRGREPHAGRYALPGGFMEEGESAEECVVREVEEETGLRTEALDLVGAYTSPERDPRGHICTLAYRLVARSGELRAGDDAAGAGFFPLDDVPPLAFDHRRILDDALRMRGRRLR